MKRITERESELWLRPYRSVRQPRVRLICFPHAGGAASAFRTWPQHLPRDVEVLAACYPGREDRLGEPLIDRMELLTEPFLDVIRPLLDRPLALFGHSMGASVAHEVAVRLDEVPDASVVGLFVSGRMPPHKLNEFLTTGFDDDEILIKEVLRLGHGNPEVFDDLELRELILPAVRGDFDLVSAYGPRPLGKVISVPIKAYVGAEDPDVDIEKIHAWSEATRGPFDCRVFPGGHFYLESHETSLAQDITDRLNALMPVSAPRQS